MPQHTFKNLTPGPKGINLEGGATVYVNGGATSEPLDVSAGELAALKKTEWFEVGSKAERASAARDPLDHDGDGRKGGGPVPKTKEAE